MQDTADVYRSVEGRFEGESPRRGCMDIDALKELAPHYVALMILVFLALTVVQVVVGEIAFWMELVIVLVVVFAYRPIVVKLGVAPSGWQ